MCTSLPDFGQNNCQNGTLEAKLEGVASDDWSELVGHLSRTTSLSPHTAGRVVEEVVAYFSEPAEGFVRRRHRELQEAGVPNAEIFGRIATELAARPVAAPRLSERQIRRLVYG